ncbi:MAG TPA: ferrochelatase [Gemmatimonadetes bacterium]|nr:ferrochelatase [Gemmatimonadota bacterium]
MKIGVLILNFGEPENPTLEEVIPFLERIFARNAPLESDQGSDRTRKLAEARAPGLIEEYKEIGGSPLAAQARKQSRMVERALRGRGLDARCYSGMQFTDPSIAAVVAEAHAAGVEQLVALPIYPLCGKSTTMAALEDVQEAVAELSWDVPLREITGWHRHPAYRRLRADAILSYVKREGVDLHAPDTTLVFSAHGTPIKYLDDGPRYAEYVEEACRIVARELGVRDYELGYQNHTNRDIKWTSPEIETVVKELDTARVIVDAVSFMHEQSETLAELDNELRETAEEAGLEYHRIPIPHDAPAFAELLADLVEGVLRPEPIMGELGLRRCLCRPTTTTFCLNAAD